MNKAGISLAIVGVLFLIVGFIAYSAEYALYQTFTIPDERVPYLIRFYLGLAITSMTVGVAMIVFGAVISYKKNPEQGSSKTEMQHTIEQIRT